MAENQGCIRERENLQHLMKSLGWESKDNYYVKDYYELHKTRAGILVVLYLGEGKWATVYEDKEDLSIIREVLIKKIK